MARKKIFVLLMVAGAVFGIAAAGYRAYERRTQPIYLRGAIIRQSTDPRKQSPIADVVVSASDEDVISPVKSDFSGAFSLRLRREVTSNNPIILHFRHPEFQPVDQSQRVANVLDVVRMLPLHGDVEQEFDNTAASVANILVRYSTQATTSINIGSRATTFQVVNRGNVPCVKKSLCSPDGQWKATSNSASLDAGEGNILRNARVSCIAGPCPFTKIDKDGFSPGGRTISVTVRDWSDTTTFSFQAEVFRSEIGDTIRQSYPVIFGRALNFTVPGSAEGTSLEAEINGVSIVFPLAPSPTLSWADCKVRVEKNQVKDYRCELKPGYRFL